MWGYGKDGQLGLGTLRVGHASAVLSSRQRTLTAQVTAPAELRRPRCRAWLPHST